MCSNMGCTEQGLCANPARSLLESHSPCQSIKIPLLLVIHSPINTKELVLVQVSAH